MTPSTIMSIALDRMGLTSTAGTFKDRAREYLNIVGYDIMGRGRWAWGFKDGSITTASGTRKYSAAANVGEFLSFRDETNDHSLLVGSMIDADRWDPDEDKTGNPEQVQIQGINASTGYWDVELWPTPDGTYTVSYRYYARWVNKTSTDDDTDLAAFMPDWVQPALIHGVAQYYYDEKGAPDQAQAEATLKEIVIDQALGRNARAPGLRWDRLRRPSMVESFTFEVQEGTLS